MYPNGADFALSLTFDVEMCTNFPYWTSQWNHRKGAIDEDSKLYMGKMLDVAEKYGVKLQFFLVGSALEDPNIDYLKRMAAEGHAVDNHTYHHVNVKAKDIPRLQPVYAERAVAGRRPECLGLHPARGATDLVGDYRKARRCAHRLSHSRRVQQRVGRCAGSARAAERRGHAVCLGAVLLSRRH